MANDVAGIQRYQLRQFNNSRSFGLRVYSYRRSLRQLVQDRQGLILRMAATDTYRSLSMADRI